jgi:magnesium-transporting ATPase (P-type)
MGEIFSPVGEAQGWNLGMSAIFAIGIIAGNVSEEILPTVMKTLAMAGQRMARCHAIIKQLNN